MLSFWSYSIRAYWIKSISSLTYKVGIHSIPGDWCGKDNCVKPKRSLNILSPSITVSDFVFQVPPAFPCHVAISVDCLQRSCQTHFYHSVAPVMLHSDEENWRALKTVLIFALMFFWQLIFLSPPHRLPVCLSPSLSPSMRVMRPHPSSPSHAPTLLMRVTPLEGDGLSLFLPVPPGRRSIFNDPTLTIQTSGVSRQASLFVADHLSFISLCSFWRTQWSSLCIGSPSVGSATLFFFRYMNLQCFCFRAFYSVLNCCFLLTNAFLLFL